MDPIVLVRNFVLGMMLAMSLLWILNKFCEVVPILLKEVADTLRSHSTWSQLAGVLVVFVLILLMYSVDLYQPGMLNTSRRLHLCRC